jgi:hypothetical protein
MRVLRLMRGGWVVFLDLVIMVMVRLRCLHPERMAAGLEFGGLYHPAGSGGGGGMGIRDEAEMGEKEKVERGRV